MEQERPPFPPATSRSSVMLQVASRLVAERAWPYRQVRISFRTQDDPEWKFCFFGSDSPEVIEEVALGKVHVAAINPGSVLTLAFRGTGPFNKAIPLRAICVIPSHDQLGFAVSRRTGLNSLSDIRERHFPLKVSLRGQENHSTHLVVKEVLSAADLSLEDIVSWGGEVRYDRAEPGDAHGFRARLAAVARGEIDAIFDEAMNIWVNMGMDAGMRFLPLEDSLLQRVEAVGLRRGTISQSKFAKLENDVPSIDFSGWPIYTHERVPDEVITLFCSALGDSRKDIPWHRGDGPLPLERMCCDTPEGPLDIPLHPGAERFWRERGYLL